MGRKRLAARRSFPQNLYQNPDGYFYFVDPRNGKKKGVGSDKTKAFYEARQANAALAVMTPSTLVDWISGSEQYTFEKWIPEYEKLWIEKTSPAAGTIKNSKTMFKYIAEADFAWRPLDQVTTAHVSKFLDKLIAEKGAPTTKNYRSRLQDMFRMAATRGFLSAGSNPVKDTYNPTTETVRERLTLEQFLLIRAQATPLMRNAMNLAVLTGQRREDITNMQFAHYSDGKLQVEQGKSQGRMRIKISGSLRLEAIGLSLEEVIRQCRDTTMSRYLLHHYHKLGRAIPGGQVGPGVLTDTFGKLVGEAGIVPAEGRTRPSFHELRSLSERLYRAERGAEFAQKILGHASPAMTSEYDKLRGSGWEEVG